MKHEYSQQVIQEAIRKLKLGCHPIKSSVKLKGLAEEEIRDIKYCCLYAMVQQVIYELQEFIK